MATKVKDDFDDAFKLLSADENAEVPVADAAAGAEAGAGAGAAGAGAEGEKPAGEAGAAGTDTTDDDGGLPNPDELNEDGTPKAKAPEGDGGAGEAPNTGTRKDPKPTAAEAAAAAAAAQAGGPTAADFLRDLRAAVAKEAAPAKAEPEAPVAVAPFSAEEKTLVDAYLAEWPEIAKAEALLRSREYQAMTAHIFEQLAPYLQNISATTGQLVTQTQLEQLRHQVPDYDEVAPKIVPWIKEQPAYLQAAYMKVAENGAVPEVVDLINRWRTGTGTAAPAAKTAAVVPPKPAAVPPKPKVDVKGLAPVRSGRSGVQSDAVANDDYDGAFKAAAALAAAEG